MHSRISIIAFKKPKLHRLLVQDLNWHLFNKKKKLNPDIGCICCSKNYSDMSLCSPVAFNAVTGYTVGVCCECMLNPLYKMEMLITVSFQTTLLLL